MRIVLCDDDPVLRGVLRGVLEQSGHEIVGETEYATQAVDFIRRFDADAIVLDLSLSSGDGLAVLRELKESGSRCHCVVFSSHIADSETLAASGATAVVTKPNFEEVESALARLADGPRAERRRRAGARHELRAPGIRSPSGFDAEAGLYEAIGSTEPDDVVVVVELENRDELASAFGAHLLVDWFLEVGRLARAYLRENDRIGLLNGDRLVLVLLDGGGQDGAEAVIKRVESACYDLPTYHHPRIRAMYAVQDGTRTAEDLLHRLSS